MTITEIAGTADSHERAALADLVATVQRGRCVPGRPARPSLRMPRSTRAAIRSLRNLTRARRELKALLGLGPAWPAAANLYPRRWEVLDFAACLDLVPALLVLKLQRTPEEVRRLEQVWAEWQREWAREWQEADARDAAQSSA